MGLCVTHISIRTIEMEISGWVKSIFLRQISLGLANEFDVKAQ